MARIFSLTATAEPEVANSLVKTLSGLFGLLLIVGIGVGLAGFFSGARTSIQQYPGGSLGPVDIDLRFFCHHFHRTVPTGGNQPCFRRQ